MEWHGVYHREEELKPGLIVFRGGDAGSPDVVLPDEDAEGRPL